MSRPHYITGLRAVEQLLEGTEAEVRRLYAEYRSANPRVQRVVQVARR